LTREPASILNGPTEISQADRILGVDESGKGDFLGPLVIAGVLIDRAGSKQLAEFNVRDSKKISDKRIFELADIIKNKCIHSIVVIGPEKYNQLYQRINNLNKLLAWGHSRVIENVAENNVIDLAVSDKFGKTDLIEQALMKKGRKVKLLQQVRAESVMAVAAGSILARAGFIRYMAKLSRLYNVTLPKGAGAPVDDFARKFVAKFGREELAKICKLHFKNYRRVIG
jgi:ribonuclease HIII